MPQLEFFALHDDQAALLNFLFDEMRLRVFESYSDFGRELREFRSTGEIEKCFALGMDIYGNGSVVLLQLWSLNATSDVEIRRIELNPIKCNGHTFRYCIEGAGLMQLYLAGLHENCKDWRHRDIQPCRCVTVSHFGHFSEKGACAKGYVSGVNWTEMRKASNRIQYHIRKRLGVARVPGRPVLAQAFEQAKSGYPLKEVARSPWAQELINQKETP
jgi:hypothetical protein